MFGNESDEILLPGENQLYSCFRYRPTLMECLLLLLLAYVYYLTHYFPVTSNHDRRSTKKTDKIKSADNDRHVSTDATSLETTFEMHDTLIRQLLQGQSILSNSLHELNQKCEDLKSDFDRLKSDLLSCGETPFQSDVNMSEKVQKQTKSVHENKSPELSTTYRDALKHGLNKEKTKTTPAIHQVIPMSSLPENDSESDFNVSAADSRGLPRNNSAHAHRRLNQKDMTNQNRRKENSQRMHTRYGAPNGHTFNDRQDLHEQDKESLPKVLLIHDSMLKYVDARRMGLSYHVNVTKKLCYTVEGIQSILDNELKENSYEAVYIHCGINNIKNQDPKDVAVRMVPIIQKLHQNDPKLKIVISRIAPTKHQNLEQKRAIFNSTLVAEFYGKCKNLSIVLHENVRKHHLRQDGIHPLRQASTTLAMNIGRCLRDLFWDPPTKVLKKISDDWWSRNITSY